MDDVEKALVVFEQEEIDQLLVVMEESMFDLKDFEPVYSKLLTIRREDSSSCRVA